MRRNSRRYRHSPLLTHAALTSSVSLERGDLSLSSTATCRCHALAARVRRSGSQIKEVTNHRKTPTRPKGIPPLLIERLEQMRRRVLADLAAN